MCHPNPLRATFFVCVLSAWASCTALAQTIPAFSYSANGASYTLAGNDPAAGTTARIPVVLVPVTLNFASGGNPPLDAASDIAALQQSPVFTPAAFPGQDTTQYVDAMLRASFRHASTWHTLFAQPEIMKTVRIDIPASSGYVLHSKNSGARMGIADLEYVQRELFKQVPRQAGRLVIAVTHNTAYYAEGDATICCLWGTHGTDQATGNSFVLASYLHGAPSLVRDQDVQPLTEQLAEFVNDPLHDPLNRVESGRNSGNTFPRWLRPASMHPGDQGRCGGAGAASAYFLLEPTDTNRKNNFPYSAPFAAGSYHLQNVALLPWYLGSAPKLNTVFSFPDPGVLSAAAAPCPSRRESIPFNNDVDPTPRTESRISHALIGYWNGGLDGRGRLFPLHAVSPQWDVIIVAFAVPDHSAPEGTLRFHPPQGITPRELKTDIANLKQQGRKVLISLGGGGQYFSLDDPKSIPVFVSCVGQIVTGYGFDGIDLDFETPSLMLAAGDTDFRHPATPSIVHLIAGLRQLRNELGPSLMITLVPEGPQMVAGHVTYSGQFGSYLPLAYGIRDILSFVDVQDYNTPPLEGLDGEIYQAGSVDYHAAMTELMLRGFAVVGTSTLFPAVEQHQVAVGFLVDETDPQTVTESMQYLIEGRRPSGASYALQQAGGYPAMLGAMFWDIDADRSEGYRFSNVIGPLLHRTQDRSAIK